MIAFAVVLQQGQHGLQHGSHPFEIGEHTPSLRLIRDEIRNLRIAHRLPELIIRDARGFADAGSVPRRTLRNTVAGRNAAHVSMFSSREHLIWRNTC